eukprot:GHVQ01023976.1.p1 GENE.GHVQ01023976.1~~GHVQ01023976.1.p1  ORF type:complete len:553 (+),score=51.39 GHVQ01023976.1:717-2375(+)
MCDGCVGRSIKRLSAYWRIPQEVLHDTCDFLRKCRTLVVAAAARRKMATLETLCEGKYVELMARLPHTKGDIVTFVALVITCGGFMAMMCVGPLTEQFGSKVIFSLALPFSAQTLLPLLLNWLPEEKKPASVANKFCGQKVKEHARVCILALVIAVVALLVAIAGTFGNTIVQLTVTLCASLLVCVMGLVCLPRTVALCNIYIYLSDTLYVCVGGALEYFYLANEECVPGGPHFDLTFYYTNVAVIGMVATAVGIWLFQTVMGSWKFRRVFWTTTVIRVAASAVDWIIVKRLNIQWGIPDKWMYLFGNAIIYQVCQIMDFMPSVILTARLCPKHLESTIHSILTSYLNFGYSCSKILGVVAMSVAGIKSQPPCDFSSLPWLLVWCHGVLPLLCIPLTFVLIPDAYMSEPLADKVYRPSTATSTADPEDGPSTKHTGQLELVPPTLWGRESGEGLGRLDTDCTIEDFLKEERMQLFKEDRRRLSDYQPRNARQTFSLLSKMRGGSKSERDWGTQETEEGLERLDTDCTVDDFITEASMHQFLQQRDRERDGPS